MKIHEYQAKDVLREGGVFVPRGKLALTVDEAVEAARWLEGQGVKVFVVKAQIHAGGRGKGGGVKIAKSVADVKTFASQILGMQLVTHQTGPEGKKVQRLYIEEGNPPRKEMYYSLILDRDRGCVSVLASPEGGMDVEEVASKHPEKILTLPIDPTSGWQSFHTRRVCEFLGFGQTEAEKHLTKQAQRFFEGLYQVFWKKDCSILEINPLCICGEGESSQLVALDAKINFDDNGLGRHPEITELRDFTEEDEAEIEASKYGLNFITLDGNIGCMVNGAGLAMATMDIIKSYGGEPANFLDVGGGATKDQVSAAFRLISKDPKVKAIFVNIFGGIMKCDVIAEGVISAIKEVGLKVPLVVRLEGTNVEKGRDMLNQSGLKVITATSMGDGAEKVVRAMKESR